MKKDKKKQQNKKINKPGKKKIKNKKLFGESRWWKKGDSKNET